MILHFRIYIASPCFPKGGWGTRISGVQEVILVVLGLSCDLPLKVTLLIYAFWRKGRTSSRLVRQRAIWLQDCLLLLMEAWGEKAVLVT